MDPESHATKKEDRNRQTASTIEAQLRSDIHALNTRDFSPTSPLFTNRPPDFVLRCNRHGAMEEKMTFLELTNWLREIYETYPEYEMLPVDMETVVDEKAGKAEVFVNTQVAGVAKGLKLHSVMSIEYKLADDGRWMMIAYRGVWGMGTGGGWT